MSHATLNAQLGVKAPPRVAYKLKEAAEMLGLSPNTIRRLVKGRELIAVRATRHLLFTPEAITKFLNRNSQRNDDLQ